MNRSRKIGLMLCLAIFSTGLFAQDGRLKMKLNYNVGVPVGSMKNDYIGNTSYRGASGEIGYWFNPKFALGLGVGYQSYYQKYGRQVYKLDDNQTISAVVSNTVELMPVTINGTFVPMAGTQSWVQPYITAGAGLNLVNYAQYLGEFSEGKPSASFTASAGAGLMVPIGKSKATNFQLGASYNMTPYNKNGLTSLNTVGFNAGITFPIR